MFDQSGFAALTSGFTKPLDMLARRHYPGLHYTIYPQFAFDSPEREQFLRITRAPKKPGDGGSHFWLAANLGEAGDDISLAPLVYVRESRFERIDESAFKELLLQVCQPLMAPPMLPGTEAGALLGALQVTSTRTEPQLSLFAEYQHEFFDLLWWAVA